VKHTIFVATGLLLAALLAGCGPSQSMADAIRNASVSDVRKHIKAGFDVNGPARDSGSGNTLHYAAGREAQTLRSDGSERTRAAYRDVVKWLIGAGADIEARNAQGKTPLHVAALKGAIVTAEVLLDYGASVNARSEPDGMTPLLIELHSWASDDKYDTAMAELLLARGADVNAADAEGATPLHRAATNRMPEMCELLIEQGASVNARDHRGHITIPGNNGMVGNQRFLMEQARLQNYGAS